MGLAATDMVGLTRVLTDVASSDLRVANLGGSVHNENLAFLQVPKCFVITDAWGMS